MLSGFMVVTVVEMWWWGGTREMAAVMETGQQVPPWGVPLWAFMLPFHNKQSCCCFGREIRMPGRYRQPSNHSSIESISAV